MVEHCLICRKDISFEVPNNQFPDLCQNCAKKEIKLSNAHKTHESQKTLFDGFKH